MPRMVCLWERHSTPVIAKPLHLFERILLDAGLNTLLCDAVEIDEYFATQEAIHFFLSCSVAKHQSFDCAGFVTCKMINMQKEKALHSLKRRIDEPYERGPLLCPVKSPTALIDEISVLVSCHHTEEIFKSTLSDERIACEIEKDVADRG